MGPDTGLGSRHPLEVLHICRKGVKGTFQNIKFVVISRGGPCCAYAALFTVAICQQLPD